MTTEPSSDAAAARPGIINRVLGGRYEVLEVLGEGPLLLAYRARDRAQNRIVTLKALRPAFAEQPRIVDALRAGLGQTLSLTHNSISRTYDVGTDDELGLVYLAEEYVRGIDLKERIRRAAPFQLSAAAETAIAIAEGLEFAHERGIAHGDVRPQNVLIGPEGQVKLTNFGVAVAQMRAILDEPALLKRVAGYISPEAVQSAAPSAADDLYSLGIILYEMLTGDTPFGADGIVQDDASPRQVNTGVPVALDGLVRKALAKNPQTRYSSAAEMLKDLRTIRDALRYGRSLSWSPLEQTGSPVVSGQWSAVGGEEPTVSGVNTVAPTTSTPPQNTTFPPPTTDHRPLTTAEVVMPRRMETTAPDTGNAAIMPGSRPVAAAPQETMEDNLPPVRATGSRWLAFINLFLGLILVGALGYLVYLAADFLKPIEEVVVPNLVGKRLADAKTMAIEQKFELAIVAEEFRDKEAQGYIFRQGENPGVKVKQGKPIPIWVSKGPRMVEVPDVRDNTYDKARRVLEAKGLRLGNFRSEYDALTPKGTVLRQLPEPGENRPRGTKIDIVISRGEEPATPEPYVEPTPEPDPTPDATLPSETEPTPTPEPSPTPEGEARKRYFRITYPVPDDKERHRIRIDVLDDRGPRTVYSRTRRGGNMVEYDVEAVGSKVTVKVYDNDELRSELIK